VVVIALSIIFLNRYFYPDFSATSQILSDLAFGLAERDETVIVITSRQTYENSAARLPAHEVINGVKVHRIWTTQFGRSNLLGRAIDYLTFYLSAAWTLLRQARRGDVVVAKTDPPMLSVVTAPISRVRGAQQINWLQDLFPEVAQALGVGRGAAGRLVYRVLISLRNWSLRVSACNVVLGERMRDRLRALGIPETQLMIISNWADGQLIRSVPHASNPLRSSWGFADRFVVAYSGNLGRAHEFETFLNAIELMEHQSDSIAEPLSEDNPSTEGLELQVASSSHSITWLFIGSGALYQAFQTEVERRRLSNVVFKPYQPRQDLDKSLSAADVHLVSLKPELECLIVPSKFYGISAAGRPTVFIGDPDGEVARLVSRHECGVTVSQGDSKGLARVLRHLAQDPARCEEMGRKAERAFSAEYDKPTAVRSWTNLLQSLRREIG